MLNHNGYKQCIKVHFRYIDDTLILFNGANSQKFWLTLNCSNINNKNMQFTLKIRINDKINFLNLIINISNDNFNFNIYKNRIQTTYNFYN